jgi:hypothetical protein
MVWSFNSALPSEQLQRRLIRAFYEINRKEFSFEEAAYPTIPGCRIIFEFGLADAESFNYVDEEEVRKALSLLEKERLDTMDFFCAIRYYKGKAEERRALKFDYYLIRTVYNRDIFEIQVHHKKGLGYLSPEDLTSFIFNKINEASNKKILRKVTA